MTVRPPATIATASWGFRSAVCLLACTLAVLVNSALAKAESIYPIAFESGIWTFHPIVSDNQGVVQTKAILAIAKPNEVFGSNVIAILYTKPQVEGADWDARAWTERPDAVLKTLATEFSLGVADFDLLSWAGVDPAELGSAGSVYYKGFLADDPIFANLATSSIRDQLVEALKPLGYSVADVPFEKSSVCSANKSLDQFALATERYAAGSSTSEITSGASSNLSAACTVPFAAIQITYPWNPRLPSPWNPTYEKSGCRQGEYGTWTCSWIRTRTRTAVRDKCKISFSGIVCCTETCTRTEYETVFCYYDIMINPDNQSDEPCFGFTPSGWINENRDETNCTGCPAGF